MEEQRYLDNLIIRYPCLAVCQKEIENSYRILKECYKHGGKLLIAGNGGSAADAEHMVGELMKGFRLPRRIPAGMGERFLRVDLETGKLLAEKLEEALPAIALNNHPALSTAYLNDVDGELVYAQQVYGYGNQGDVLLVITTSGNSKNVLAAAVAAKGKDMPVIALTGKTGGKIRGIADVSVCVPEQETFLAQELHLPVYHCLCLMLEEYFYHKNRANSTHDGLKEG